MKTKIPRTFWSNRWRKCLVGPPNLLTFGTVYWNTIAAASHMLYPNPYPKSSSQAALVRTPPFLLLHLSGDRWPCAPTGNKPRRVCASRGSGGGSRVHRTTGSSDNPAGRFFFPIIYWGMTMTVVMVQLSQQCTWNPPLSNDHHLHRQAGQFWGKVRRCARLLHELVLQAPTIDRV
jgi:hypothetical protein